MKRPFDNFVKTFKAENGGPYLEESVLWYCMDANPYHYLGLSLHERINWKQSYYNYKK